MLSDKVVLITGGTGSFGEKFIFRLLREYNPFEAIKTNIYGAQNIIDAAIDKKVKKVVALSTGKAVDEGFEYNSSTNLKWLNVHELKKALKSL